MINEMDKNVLLDELVRQVQKYLELRKYSGNDEEMIRCSQEIQSLFKALHQDEQLDGNH